MQYLLAHDLGTSGDKASLFTVDGTLVKSVVASYPCSYGSGNCVEQNPEAWYAAVCRTTQSLASLVDPARIAGVSFSGHMMGAVLLDGSGALLRPAIIWADQRAASSRPCCLSGSGTGGSMRLPETATIPPIPSARSCGPWPTTGWTAGWQRR